MARVIVCGDRHYADEKYVWDRLDEQDRRQPGGLTYVIDGTAAGADTFGFNWRTYRQRGGARFAPHWRHTKDCEPSCQRPVGKRAGVLRNQQMLDEGRPDLVIAFHNDIGQSRGTRDMIRRAVKAGIPTFLYEGGPHASYQNSITSLLA